MRDYIRLSKLLIKMQFKSDGNKSKKGNTIAYIILGAVFAVVIAVAMIFMGSYVKEYEFTAEMSAVIMEMGFIIVLIFGTMHILSYMYFSPDNEFLLSLPVKPGVVYAAKLTVVYVTNAALSAVIVVPGLLFLGITAGQGVLFYIMAIIAAFLVPVFPLLIASILAVPLMYITSLFKHKGLITSILLIVVFAGFMIGYMLLFTNLGYGSADESEVDIGELMNMLKGAVTNMAIIIYPFYALGRFMTLTTGLADSLGTSMLIDAGIFFGSLIAAGVIVVVFSSAFYRKSALRQLENPTKTNIIAKEHVESTAYKALLKKEWRELARNSSFAFQCLAGVIVAPIITVMMSIMFGSTMFDGEMDAAIGYMIMWMFSQFMVQMMGVGMNFFSMTAITREGKSYEVSKTIPVDYATQLKAKKTIGLIIMAVPVCLSLIVMQIMQMVYGNYNPTLFFFAAAALLIFGYGFTCYFINRDLKKPNLHWSTPAEAVKNNKATLLPFFMNMGISLACTIVVVVFGVIGYMIDMYIVLMIVGYVILIGAGIGFSVPMHKALKKNTNYYYNILGDS